MSDLTSDVKPRKMLRINPTPDPRTFKFEDVPARAMESLLLAGSCLAFLAALQPLDDPQTVQCLALYKDLDAVRDRFIALVGEPYVAIVTPPAAWAKEGDHDGDVGGGA